MQTVLFLVVAGSMYEQFAWCEKAKDVNEKHECDHPGYKFKRNKANKKKPKKEVPKIRSASPVGGHLQYIAGQVRVLFSNYVLPFSCWNLHKPAVDW